MTRTGYRWREQGNATYLAGCLEAYVATHGMVCQGASPTGRDAHPSDVLEPFPIVPLSAGGAFFGEVMVLCPFCRQKRLAIVSEAIAAVAARRQGRADQSPAPSRCPTPTQENDP